jgi:hypothetical protein
MTAAPREIANVAAFSSPGGRPELEHGGGAPPIPIEIIALYALLA